MEQPPTEEPEEHATEGLEAPAVVESAARQQEEKEVAPPEGSCKMMQEYRLYLSRYGIVAGAAREYDGRYVTVLIMDPIDLDASAPTSYLVAVDPIVSQVRLVKFDPTMPEIIAHRSTERLKTLRRKRHELTASLAK